MPVSTPEISQESVADTCVARGAMTLHLLRGLPSDSNFRDEWNSLVESMESPQIFYTWEWARAMCLAYGTQNFLLLTAYRADRLVGVVALIKNCAGEVSFLTAATAEYCDFVSTSEDRKEFVHLASARLRGEGMNAFQFANLPENSFILAAIKSAMLHAGCHIYSRPAYRCARIQLGSQAVRVEAEKSARRRKSKSPKAFRSAEVVHGASWRAWAASFDDFAAAHVGRFLSEGKISNLACTERREFLRMLGELLEAKSWLGASMIKVNGKPVSWHFGMRFAGTWFWYQPAFDCDWLHAGPGTYLLNDLIQLASKDAACHTIDLGLGDEGYKQRYVTSVQRTLHVYAHRSVVQVAKAIFRYRAAAFLKRCPQLDQAARKFARHISSDVEKRGKVEASRALKPLDQLLRTREEIIAFQWQRRETKIPDQQSSDYKVQSLSLKLLALAAIKHEKDAPTIAYLLQCAAWLKSANKEGLVLLDSEGTPVHFCWTTRAVNIHLREFARIKALRPDSIFISGSLTPNFYRENHLQFLVIISEQISASGREPWILAATRDLDFTSDLKRAGFVARFTIPRRSRFRFTYAWKRTTVQPEPLMDFDTAA